MPLSNEEIGRRAVEFLHALRSGQTDESDPRMVDVLEAMRLGKTYQDLFGADLQMLRDALGAFRPSSPPGEAPFHALIAELLAPLTPEGKVNAEFVLRWLRQVAADVLTCPICHSNSWIVGEFLVQPTAWPATLDGIVDTYPHVLVTCHACGYTFQLNAAIIGILDDRTQRGAYKGTLRG